MKQLWMCYYQISTINILLSFKLYYRTLFFFLIFNLFPFLMWSFLFTVYFLLLFLLYIVFILVYYIEADPNLIDKQLEQQGEIGLKGFSMLFERRFVTWMKGWVSQRIMGLGKLKHSIKCIIRLGYKFYLFLTINFI